jgi:hypothetical protein
MINPKISLVWTNFGSRLAVGVRNSSPISGRESVQKNQSEMERIYNFFYNFNLTGGEFYKMSDGQFGYFLMFPQDLKKILGTGSVLAPTILKLVKNSIEENFLIEHNKIGAVI